MGWRNASEGYMALNVQQYTNDNALPSCSRWVSCKDAEMRQCNTTAPLQCLGLLRAQQLALGHQSPQAPQVA
jgi:hypothetical protein